MVKLEIVLQSLYDDFGESEDERIIMVPTKEEVQELDDGFVSSIVKRVRNYFHRGDRNDR